MRTLACPFLLSSLLVACGGDDNPPGGPDASMIDSGSVTIDAGVPDTGGGPADMAVIVMPDAGGGGGADAGMVGIYDFSCADDPLPTMAGDPLSVSGTLTDFQTSNALSGANVEGRLRSDDSVLDTDTTAMDGSFTLSAATGGTPIDAYLFFSTAMYPDTYLYPPDPLANDVAGLGAGTISSSTLNLVYNLFAGGHMAGNGTEVALVIDCAGTPIEGASVSFAPAPATMAYLAGMLPSTTATATDASGVAFGFNAAAGDTTVSATFMGVALRSHSMEVTADALSLTIIHP